MICYRFHAFIFLYTLTKYLVLHDLVHPLPQQVGQVEPVNVHAAKSNLLSRPKPYCAKFWYKFLKVKKTATNFVYNLPQQVGQVKLFNVYGKAHYDIKAKIHAV